MVIEKNLTQKLTAKNLTRLYPLAQILEVHDGDTLRLLVDLGFSIPMARVWIRLKDVRAPELKEGQPALEAKQAVMDWIHDYAPDKFISVTTFQVETMVKEIREQMTFIRYVGTIESIDIVAGGMANLNFFMRSKGYIDQGD